MEPEIHICLGIDLGTTSVKLSLVNADSKSLICSTSEPTKANISCAGDSLTSEQDVFKIFNAVCTCLMRITERNRSNIRCISISGQMHGMMLWNSDQQCSISDNSLPIESTSTLVTWEDKRATPEFLNSLPKPDSHQAIASGFGCVTLFWLLRKNPEMLVKYDTVGGIMDYLVMLLCGLDKPVMSDQIAASWGYFNCDTGTWNYDILKENYFPVHVLPNVVRGGTKVGELCKRWFNIVPGTPVLTGLGDLQCSFLSATAHHTDAVMNISTSSQVCYQITYPDFVPPRSEAPLPVSYFPYFSGSYLAVAASLNGGNVLDAFVKMLLQWFNTFGIEMTEDLVWNKLTELSSQSNTSLSASRNDASSTRLLDIHPVLFGERHKPDFRASVSGITIDNTSIDCVFHSLCAGLVTNLHQMMPQTVLMESGVNRLVLTGSVVHRQHCIADYVRKYYLPLSVVKVVETDAAFGAACVAIKYLESSVK